MRVGVDARHLAGGRGVAHYTNAVLTALAAEHPADEWRAFAARGGARETPGVRLVRSSLPSRALFGPAAVAGRPRLDRLLGGDLDVVWIPAPAPVAISPGVPYALTVHDLSWIEHPEWFTRYERLWHRLGRMERLAARAARVVAVSQVTADAIARHWPSVDAGRVRVVPSGIAQVPPDEPRAALDARLPERFVVAVGALEPRKDPELLVRAHARAIEAGLDADLVFAGGGRLAGRLEGERVHVLGHVGELELRRLYRDALALAMPTRLEGFGFPPFEAAMRGTPSVVSDLPVFAETLGDTALKVAPGDEHAWAGALVRICGDEALRDRLGREARDAATRFTWTATARGLHAALREAAGA